MALQRDVSLTATYQEIVSQTQAWRQALEVTAAHATDLRLLWQEGHFDRVLFTGCGSTYYLSLAAATLFQTLTGVPARGVPAGELVLYPEAAYTPGRTLLVAISRSAETSETVQAVQAFRRTRAGETIVISNYGDRPLSQLGAIRLIIPAGQEKSIAQTRSFASMYVAATATAALLAGREDLIAAMEGLPAVGCRLIEQYESLARTLGADASLDRYYFLGSGPRYGLACEANLKMKEMTLTHSEPFHFLEFRHGPKSMAGESAVIVGLLSDSNRIHEQAVLDDMRLQQAHILSLGESAADVSFGSGIPETVRCVLYLPVLQLMAFYRAASKGLDPDHPAHLDAVVKLDFEN